MSFAIFALFFILGVDLCLVIFAYYRAVKARNWRMIWKNQEKCFPGAGNVAPGDIYKDRERQINIMILDFIPDRMIDTWRIQFVEIETNRTFYFHGLYLNSSKLLGRGTPNQKTPFQPLDDYLKDLGWGKTFSGLETDPLQLPEDMLSSKQKK